MTTLRHTHPDLALFVPPEGAHPTFVRVGDRIDGYHGTASTVAIKRDNGTWDVFKIQDARCGVTFDEADATARRWLTAGHSLSIRELVEDMTLASRKHRDRLDAQREQIESLAQTLDIRLDAIAELVAKASTAPLVGIAELVERAAKAAEQAVELMRDSRKPYVIGTGDRATPIAAVVEATTNPAAELDLDDTPRTVAARPRFNPAGGPALLAPARLGWRGAPFNTDTGLGRIVAPDDDEVGPALAMHLETVECIVAARAYARSQGRWFAACWACGLIDLALVGTGPITLYPVVDAVHAHRVTSACAEVFAELEREHADLTASGAARHIVAASVCIAAYAMERAHAETCRRDNTRPLDVSHRPRCELAEAVERARRLAMGALRDLIGQEDGVTKSDFVLSWSDTDALDRAAELAPLHGVLTSPDDTPGTIDPESERDLDAALKRDEDA
jgi:hypothetical protein